MKRFLKIFGGIIAGILILIIGLVIFLQTPPGQRVLRNIVVNFLEKKLGTPVQIDRIAFSIPKNIKLEGVLFIDKNNDTLLSLDYLNANIAMLQLLNNKLKVNALDIEGLQALMHRPAGDTVFNYQFIIDAFSDTTETTVLPEEELGTVEEGKAQSMLFNIARVRLKDINFTMDDQAGGTYFDLKLDSLVLKPREINPGNMTYLIDELDIYRAQTHLHTFTGTIPPEVDTTTETTPLVLSAGKLSLAQSSFRMLTEPDSFYLYTGIEKLDVDLEIFDLQNALIRINDILLESSNNEIVLGRSSAESSTEDIAGEEEDADTLWKIYGQKIVLNNINFRFDDNEAPRLAQGMDYSHMHFTNLHMILEDLNFLTDSIYGNLQHLATEEKSGLKLITLRTEFLYHEKGAELNDLFIQTPETVIQDRLQVSYPSLAAISDNPGMIYINAQFQSSQIAVNDIMLFSPADLLSTLSPYKNQLLKMNGGITGYLSNLRINDIRLEGLTNTRIHLDGLLTGLPDTEKMRYEFNTLSIESGSRDILPFIPADMTESISLPDHLKITGRIRGTATDYHPDLDITTSDGDIALNGQVNVGSNPERYDLSIATRDLDIGKIIRNDSLVGKVSLSGQLSGTSFDLKAMNADLVADVAQLEFNGYNYSQVHLLGNIKNELIELNMRSRDFNADMDVYALVDISGEYPAVTSTLQLRRVDVRELGFSPDALELAGNIDLKFKNLNPDYPEGYVNWLNPSIRYQDEDIVIDSLYISSAPSPDSGQNITAFIPGLLDARLKGQIPLTQIGTVAMQHINKYFTFNPNLEPFEENYNADIQAELNNHPLIQKVLPDFDSFATINLAMKMNPSDFNFDLTSAYLSYGQHTINELDFKINDSNDALVYGLYIDDYSQKGGGLFVNRPMLFGHLKDNLLEGHFKTYDIADIEHYALGFKSTYTNDRYILSLLPVLKLNYDNWSAPAQNWAVYHMDSGLIVNNIGISRGGQSINILSSELKEFNSPIDININNFELANLSRILNPDTLLAEGILDARVNADIRDTFPRITGNLNVDKLKFYDTEVGNLAAKVSNPTLDIFDLEASVTQLSNNIYVDGQYYMTPVDSNDFDIDIDMQSLSLKQFEGFAFGQLKDSRGFLKGALNLKGTTDKPRISGFLETDDLATRITMINSFWTFPAERIEFNDQTISFRDFKIYDSLGQNAVISGSAVTKDFTAFDLNLNFSSDRWMATNSTNKDYEWMYGKIILTSDIDITGTSSAPVLNGTLKVHDSTDFTYANIDDGPGMSDHDGYVVFVDDIYRIDTILTDTSATARSSAMSMNLNIETEKDATFNVLVNPLSGDILSVNGAAFLNANMIPGGKFLLTGSYQIDDGFYELNYNFIKRKFKIQEGSSIQLTGDPMQAEVDITAAYTTDASAYDLMERTASQDELVFYKQRMPFDVLLKISGKPLSPGIKYDIVLSEENARSVDRNVADNIQRQLSALRNDVSEMSKQVFGMLVLGRFIAEDPIKSGNPVSMEYYARQTASRFLSQQLNNFADKYVGGLDLSLDIESQEDFSTGQRENRTDLNFRASKSLLDDRLTVTIGNDFQIEGRQLPGQQNNLIPGNISLDYKLTKDGKYNIRGYRKNELLNVIDGYVIETGAGIMLNYDYNRFRELFYSREKLRELYRKRREEERRKEEEKQVGHVKLK